MSKARSYTDETKDNEMRKYFYGFDYDVMHPFMLKSFLPHFRNGNVLELGSFEGQFTKRLLPHFHDITCVEASNDAVQTAQKSLVDSNINFYHSLFEDVKLPHTYNNIIMSHVLEHVSDPISVLKRVNEEWLSDDGRFFLVCPNANAPSRQIAVKMGLIPYNAAVTEGEKLHGHHITYSLDTLEREARAAGFNVIQRSGIFFKALANFQFDKILKTDIISKEYLEGCYQLGHVYPDLCASIFLLCEKGK